MGIGQGDTIVITVDGQEVGRLRIPEEEQFTEHSTRVFTIDLSGKALTAALARHVLPRLDITDRPNWKDT